MREMKVWNEIKNFKDLKPYVYGLKKECYDRIKKLERENIESNRQHAILIFSTLLEILENDFELQVKKLNLEVATGIFRSIEILKESSERYLKLAKEMNK